MANYLLSAASAVGDPVVSTVTKYFNVCGNLVGDSIEANNQNLARSEYTLSDLYVRVSANTVTAATTVRSRDAGANGNQSVSIPSSTTGVFEDTTNTDVISSGALFNSQAVVGGTGTSITFNIISYTLEDATGTTWIVSQSGLLEHPLDVTLYHNISGDGIDEETSEVNAQYRCRSNITWTNMRIYVEYNGADNAGTATFRVGGAAGNQSVSIPAATSGAFEDTTNSDVITNDLINYELVFPAGGIFGVGWHTWQMKGDGVERLTATSGDASFDAPLVRYHVVDGQITETATEADTQLDVRNTHQARHMFVRLSVNGTDAATTWALRVDGATSALSISVPSSTTGEFENTSDIVNLAEDDEINYIIDTSGATAGGTLNYEYLGCMLGEVVMPVLDVSPAVFQKLLVLAY